MKITIASGKGGTGKTTISTNFSSYLAERKKVVLADLDVEEPNSGLFIKGEPVLEKACHKMIPQWVSDECTLCGKCEEVCNFNAIVKLSDEILVFPELCHSCYACSELCPTDSLPMMPQKMGMLKHIKTDSFDFVEGRLDLGEEQAVPLIGQVINYVVNPEKPFQPLTTILLSFILPHPKTKQIKISIFLSLFGFYFV